MRSGPEYRRDTGFSGMNQDIRGFMIMAGGVHDVVHDLISGQASGISLETPTTEAMQEISTYFEAAEGLLGHSSDVDLSPAAESDSADRPVVKLVPGHLVHGRPHSDATSASEDMSGAESGSSSVYHKFRSPAAAAARGKSVRGRKWAFQAYSDPFLEENSFRTSMPPWKRGSMFSSVQQEARIKTFAVGGFFKCVRLWHRVNKGRLVTATSLPAAYMDIEDEVLSPLSEGNDTSDDDGIKIVGNEFFVKSRKVTSPPPPAQTKKRVPAKRGRPSRPVHEKGSCVKNGKTKKNSKKPLKVTALEATSLEATALEATTLEATALDATSLEATALEAIFLEATALEATALEDTVLEATALEATALEATALEDTALEATILEDTTLEATSLEATALEATSLETPGISQKTSILNIDADDNSDGQRTRKKKKKKRKVTEEEGSNVSVDINPALEATSLESPNISQTTSETLIDHANEHETRTKKKRKRKVTEEEGSNVSADISPALEATALEATGLESPGISQTTSETLIDHPNEHGTRTKKKRKHKVTEEEGSNVSVDISPALEATALEATTLESPDISQRTSETLIDHPNEHGMRTKKKRKHKVTEEEGSNVSADISPALEATALEATALESPDISQRTSETLIDHANEHGMRTKKKRKHKVTEEEGSNVSADISPALEATGLESPGISQRTSGSIVIINNNNNNNADAAECRTRTKKNKRKRKVTEDENRCVSLDGPCSALETPDSSQPPSGSTTAIIDQRSVEASMDQLEDPRKPRKKSKKNKKRSTSGVATEDSVNGDGDADLTHETGPPTQVTTAGIKKRKRKKDKMAACPPEDPEAEPEAAEKVPPRHPADGEVGERPREKRRKRKTEADVPRAEGTDATSVRQGRKGKRGPSLQTDDTSENHPEPDINMAVQPVGNGEMVKMKKKKKKREREASGPSMVEDDDDDQGACEGATEDARRSVETAAADGVQKKKKKKKNKHKTADRESESPLVVVAVGRETPDDIEADTASIMKRDARRKSTGRVSIKPGVDSAVATVDTATVSVDVDGDGAVPNGGGTATDPTSEKKTKTGKKREKNASAVVPRDTAPPQDIGGEPEVRLKRKKRKKEEKDERVRDWLEAAADPGAVEAQCCSHEAGATSAGRAPTERRTQLHREPSAPSPVSRKKQRSQQHNFLDT